MGSFLSKEQLELLADAETAFDSPIPTQMISNGEFWPVPQTPEQKQVEERIQDLSHVLGKKQGMARRDFLKTAGGMAAAFLAMNQVYGPVFRVVEAEAAQDAAAARAAELAKQFVFDAQVHFIKDDSPAGTNPARMLGIRQFAAGFLNQELQKAPLEIEHLKFQNFVKEVFFDSDTKLAILSGAPSDDIKDWFLSNDQMNQARSWVNDACGSKRLMSHAVFTPGQPGWLEEMDRVIEQIRPDSWKGYTTGDPNGPSEYRWRLDDDELVYPAYKKMMKSGIRNICIHKGLLPPNAEASNPGVTAYAGVDDVGKAAQDWPELNFIIYHAAYNVLMPTSEHMKNLEERGYVEWASDLAAIPKKFGVSNVYAEIGSSFGISAVMQPKFCAGMMGELIKGMGEDNVFWGTDSVWYGSPQWQIEALRRIEIPQELQDKFGYAPLGPEDGPVKQKILGLNLARHYGLDVEAVQKELGEDKLSAKKAKYEAAGTERSNLAYGFIDKRI